MEPIPRVAALKKFISRLMTTPGSKAALEKWGVEFSEKGVEVQARTMGREKVWLGHPVGRDGKHRGPKEYDYQQYKSDWSSGKQVLSAAG